MVGIKDKPIRTRKFANDHRDNAGLHLLYVKFAISGLLAIDAAIRRIDSEAKTSHSGILCAMFKERNRLLREDAAYAEANEFLLELVAKGLLTKIGDIFVANFAPEDI
jgi:hypothetical protein